MPARTKEVEGGAAMKRFVSSSASLRVLCGEFCALRGDARLLT